VNHPVPAPLDVGRPPRWVLLVAVAVAVAVTADLLAGGVLEDVDRRVAEVIDSWGLRDSAAYPVLWLLSQVGGRGTIVVTVGVLAVWLAWRRRTLRPPLRVVGALALLTVVVYGLKYGTGRTAPAYPGSYFHRGGQSFPSGHAANAVLMWGVARWQAVEYGLPPAVQRMFAFLAVGGPAITAAAMLAVNFHWLTDAVVGAAVGVLLLGAMHIGDALLGRRALTAGREAA
jgi:membrane-associated phospholipid phosphatase